MPTLSPLNLRQLQHVVLAADEGHFGRAAARAFLSQSAFSRSIAALEDQIGMRLFDRGPGFVRLTDAGAHVVARARRLLSSSVDLNREIDLLRSGDLGNLAVGSGPFSGPTLMAAAVADLQAVHPGVHVAMEIGAPMTLQHRLLTEEIDFFVADVNELPPHANCQVVALGTGTGALFVRPQHPLARRSGLTLDDVRGQPLASVHVPTPLSRRLTRLFGGGADEPLELALCCESTLVLREYALRHDVMVIAPPEVLELEVAAGRLCRLHVAGLDDQPAGTPLRMDLGLVSLRDRTPSMAATLLADLVRKRALTTLTPAVGAGPRLSAG